MTEPLIRSLDLVRIGEDRYYIEFRFHDGSGEAQTIQIDTLHMSKPSLRCFSRPLCQRRLLHDRVATAGMGTNIYRCRASMSNIRSVWPSM